jgi:hypothetical protein
VLLSDGIATARPTQLGNVHGKSGNSNQVYGSECQAAINTAAAAKKTGTTIYMVAPSGRRGLERAVVRRADVDRDESGRLLFGCLLERRQYGEPEPDLLDQGAAHSARRNVASNVSVVQASSAGPALPGRFAPVPDYPRRWTWGSGGFRWAAISAPIIF